MNKEDLISKLVNKRVRDYTFPVIFFIIFSIFVFFAIRPNLITAASLQRQLDELRLQDEQYETVILNIVNYQSIIEQTRQDFVVLEEAVPSSPQIFSVVDDIRRAATESGMLISNMDISDVILKGIEGAAGEVKTNSREATQPSLKDKRQFVIKFQATSSFNEMRQFLNQLATQRRLKKVESMNVSAANKESSGSATFSISLVIESFYL